MTTGPVLVGAAVGLGAGGIDGAGAVDGAGVELAAAPNPQPASARLIKVAATPADRAVLRTLDLLT
jgi:hypothetical protein